MARIARHWKIWLLTAVMAVAALAIGGPYVYANVYADVYASFITKDAPPPSSVALPSVGADTAGDTPAR